MGDWWTAVLVGAAFGLVMGLWISRDSNKKQAVVGGGLPRALHYLACSAMPSVLPFVITGIILGLPFLYLIGTGLGFLALAFALLIALAVLERGAVPAAAK